MFRTTRSCCCEIKEWIDVSELSTFIFQKKTEVTLVKGQSGSQQTVNRTQISIIEKVVDDTVASYGGLEKLSNGELSHLMGFFTEINNTEKLKVITAMLKEQGNFLTPHTTRNLLHIASRVGDILQFTRVLSQAKSAGVKLLPDTPDKFMECIMLSKSIYNRYELAMEFITLMRNKNAIISSRIIKYALACCSTYFDAKTLIRIIDKSGLSWKKVHVKNWDEKLWSCLIKTCRHDASSAERVVKDMKQYQFKQTSRTTATLMSIYNTVQDFNSVVQLFEDAVKNKFPMTPIMLTEVIKACSIQARKPNDLYTRLAEKTWKVVTTKGFENDMFLWKIMATVYARTGASTRANALLNRMIQLKLKPCKEFMKAYRTAIGESTSPRSDPPTDRLSKVDEEICNNIIAVTSTLIFDIRQRVPSSVPTNGISPSSKFVYTPRSRSEQKSKHKYPERRKPDSRKPVKWDSRKTRISNSDIQLVRSVKSNNTKEQKSLSVEERVAGTLEDFQ